VQLPLYSGTIARAERKGRYLGVIARVTVTPRIESRGGSVGNRPDGRPWNHVNEVRDAQQGLRNRIGQINRELGHPNLDPARREALQSELGQASRNLDQSRRYLPR
jgi:hypothetical protein